MESLQTNPAAKEDVIITKNKEKNSQIAQTDGLVADQQATTDEEKAPIQIVSRICEPGFLCRRHTLIRNNEHALQKINAMYACPVLADDIETEKKSYSLWTWAEQDAERNFSILDVKRGVFNLSEKAAPGGRVYAMTATGEGEKRIWIGTADFDIQVYSYKKVGDPQCLWTFHMKDSVFALETEVEGGRVKRVFASLANGTLCVFSRNTAGQSQQTSLGDAKLIPETCTISCDDEQYRREAEEWTNPFILLLGEPRKAARCIVFVGQEQLWCGCGNTISVVNIPEMKVVKSIPVFVKKTALVYELVSNGSRVWGVGRQLSCVMEWDTKTLSLVHVFNCNIIDPTGDRIISDPKLIDHLYIDLEATRQPFATISESTGELSHSSPRFSARNDSKKAAPFSQSPTHHALRGLHQVTSIEEDVNPTGKPPVSSTHNRDLHGQKGSTRTTSLFIVKETLWVARRMGDVLIVDISGGETHGRVLARLAIEGCERFGNSSNHKLVGVAGEYVVSSQWLEPVDIRAQAQTVACPDVQVPDVSMGMAHQAITIWNAWDTKDIQQFMDRRSILSLCMK